MKKQTLIALAAGSAFAVGLAAPIAQAADNPFSARTLPAGYQLAQMDKPMDKPMEKAKDGNCGDGKTAAGMHDGKTRDGQCGADKQKMDKKKDGKCGEAKCGVNKKKH